MITITDIFKVNKCSKNSLETKFQYYIADQHNIVFIRNKTPIDIMQISVDLFKTFCISLVGIPEIDCTYSTRNILIRAVNTPITSYPDSIINIKAAYTLSEENYELLMYKLAILKCKKIISAKFNKDDIKDKRLSNLFTFNHFIKIIPKLNRSIHDFDNIQYALETTDSFDPDFIKDPFIKSMVIIQNSEYLTKYYVIKDQFDEILAKLNSGTTQINTTWYLATKGEPSFAHFEKIILSKKDILINETMGIIKNQYDSKDEYNLLVNIFQVMPNWTLKISYNVIEK